MNKLVFALAASSALTLASTSASAAPGANGTACTAAADCSSAHCVDGVCCDTACAGQCEACSVAGSLGTCTPVLGAPHGARPACYDGGGSLCAAKACDGTSRTACAGFKNGASVVCASSGCADGVASLESHCDGAGGCPAPAKVSCAPYACDAAGCKTACSSIADCQSGYGCYAGKCAPGTSTCSADGTTSISADGYENDCRPYACAGGMCRNACASDADCSKPNVCEASTGRCKDPNDKGLAAPGQSSGGGCGVGSGASGFEASAVALAFGALLGLGVARRRRARSGRNG